MIQKLTISTLTVFLFLCTGVWAETPPAKPAAKAVAQPVPLKSIINGEYTFQLKEEKKSTKVGGLTLQDGKYSFKFANGYAPADSVKSQLQKLGFVNQHEGTFVPNYIQGLGGDSLVSKVADQSFILTFQTKESTGTNNIHSFFIRHDKTKNALFLDWAADKNKNWVISKSY